MTAPPRPLPPAALGHWDRQVARLTAEGRLKAVDLELLATWCETLATHIALQAAVDDAGVLIAGRGGDLVKNPCLSPLAATRDALLRLSRAIPLVDTAAAAKRAAFDEWLEDL